MAVVGVPAVAALGGLAGEATGVSATGALGYIAAKLTSPASQEWFVNKT